MDRKSAYELGKSAKDLMAAAELLAQAAEKGDPFAFARAKEALKNVANPKFKAALDAFWKAGSPKPAGAQPERPQALGGAQGNPEAAAQGDRAEAPVAAQEIAAEAAQAAPAQAQARDGGSESLTEEASPAAREAPAAAAAGPEGALSAGAEKGAAEYAAEQPGAAAPAGPERDPMFPDFEDLEGSGPGKKGFAKMAWVRTPGWDPSASALGEFKDGGLLRFDGFVPGHVFEAAMEACAGHCMIGGKKVWLFEPGALRRLAESGIGCSVNGRRANGMAKNLSGQYDLAMALAQGGALPEDNPMSHISEQRLAKLSLAEKKKALRALFEDKPAPEGEHAALEAGNWGAKVGEAKIDLERGLLRLSDWKEERCEEFKEIPSYYRLRPEFSKEALSALAGEVHALEEKCKQCKAQEPAWQDAEAEKTWEKPKPKAPRRFGR